MSIEDCYGRAYFMETKIYSSFGAATGTSSEQSSCHSKGFRAIFTLYRGLSRGRIYCLGDEKLFFSLQEKHAASTVHRKLSSIKVFLRFLKEEDIVKEDFSLYFTKVRKEEDVILFLKRMYGRNFGNPLKKILEIERFLSYSILPE